MALICRATRAACGRTSSPHSRLLLSTYVSKMRYLFDLKEDDRACRQALNSGTFYLFHSLTPLLLKSGNRFVPPPFTLSELERLLGKFAQDPQRIEDSVLIGCSDQQEAQFALDLGLSEGSLERSAVETELQGSFTELRKALFQLEEKDVTLLSTALSLLRWHDNHQFCSKSGHPTKKNVAGSKRVCPSNGIVYYPQVSPVVITLVSDGARCLLVRQSSFPKGLYSALAGFCDVGTREHARIGGSSLVQSGRADRSPGKEAPHRRGARRQHPSLGAPQNGYRPPADLRVGAEAARLFHCRLA
uniref:Nudix hydrolase 13 n=1 Tax=Ornithorhynchus anatinus TaxID=9258 RepID=A0A6I8NQY2_ORNAN